jgi:hypothetical protein
MSELPPQDLPHLVGFDSTENNTFGNYVPDGVPHEYARDVKSLDFSNWYASRAEDHLLRTVMRKPILSKGVNALATVQHEITDALNLINNNTPVVKSKTSNWIVDKVIFNRMTWMIVILAVVVWMVWRFYKRNY